MQLTSRTRVRLGLTALMVLTLGPRAVRAAEVEAAQRFTLFLEPSSIKGNKGITVSHPQTDVSATFSTGLGVSAGYAVDIVSGATPRVFGARTDTGGRPVDAISGATKFSDIRQQTHGGFSYTRPSAEVAASYSYGWEKDYRSHAVSVNTRSDVLDHVFTIGLSYTHNFDRVCDAPNIDTAGLPLERKALVNSDDCFKGTAAAVTRKLSIDALEPSLTWAVTPRLLLQGGGTLQILDGFQANPYRQVELGSAGRRPQESLPLLRQRFALFGRAAYALPALRASIQAMVRAYRDTWAVEATTAEVSLHQYITRFLLWSARGRVHAQRGAAFYKNADEYKVFGPNGQYWTGDRELSPMQNFLVGGKLAYLRIPESGVKSFFSEIEGALKVEGLFYRLDSDFAPNSDRKFATIWQASVSARF
ncbi:MAG TPA: DUF3570 domain-containing protein [Polyangia bacterium]|nr:DUF3570 domain-containing protein [Polyangia bacterium]